MQFCVAPAVHFPLMHLSATVHTLLSALQGLLFLAALLKTHFPVEVSQESVVQGLLSLQTVFFPTVQTLSLQTSPTVQALPSALQALVLARYLQPLLLSQASVVQGLPSLQVMPLPLQTPKPAGAAPL